MNKSQIVLGTSSWGSKISFKDSIKLSDDLLKFEINHFDTAPLYGSGYSHYILNKIAEQNNISVDTKYGQNIKLGWKEFIKRCYRFINFDSFKDSFKHINLRVTERLKKDYWDIKKLNDSYNLFSKELNNCKISTFYLHGPPKYILDYEYLRNFELFCSNKNIIAGICNPDHENFFMLIEKFPNIKLQIPINFFWKNKEKILKSRNKIDIFRIFKTLMDDKEKNENNKISWKEFSNIINTNSKYKLVLGINSQKSLNKLSKIIDNNDIFDNN